MPARYILAILGSVAMAIVYGLKVNLSVAMVAMVNHTAITGDEESNATNAADVESCGVEAKSALPEVIS